MPVRSYWWMGVATLAIGAALLNGCGTSDAPPASTPTVQSQFYPLDNGLIYTYQRFLNNRYDTLNLRLVTAQQGLQNVFVYKSANGTLVTFYRVSLTHDANYNQAAVISTDTSSLMVLDGTLEDGATWVADDINRIHATVLTEYDDYYLPDVKLKDYANVLVVQYHEDGQPNDNYTLRFFAQDHGLILEQQIVQRSVISSLELIGIQNS